MSAAVSTPDLTIDDHDCRLLAVHLRAQTVVALGLRRTASRSFFVVQCLYARLRFDQVFAEYITHAKAAGTGRRIHHLFAGRLVAERGQITLLRESLNVVAAIQALNPKGAAGLPPPPDEILSVPADYVS